MLISICLEFSSLALLG